MGAAGDMLASALLELVPSPDKMVDKLNGMRIPSVRFTRNGSEKCGIKGTHLSVTINGVEEKAASHDHDHDHDHSHDHSHSVMDDIEHIVREHSSIPKKIQDDVMAVYRLIAEAESDAHGVPVSKVHFHEVGAMDAVADIAAVCLLMDYIDPKLIITSPIHVGSGQVKCAHGILPVPAPATAFILRGVPIYGGKIRGELCTPTGAALLKHFTSKFGEMPIMRVQSIGYGMGTNDFEAANCVRAFLGETESGGGKNEICELKCNIDDMTPEAVGYVQEILFKSGALDVCVTPVMMKKSRPGFLLCCMCGEDESERLAGIMLKNTTTLGVRLIKSRRFALERETETVKTKYGDVRIKKSRGYGAEKIKPEYDDVARIAAENDMTFSQASEAAASAYKEQNF